MPKYKAIITTTQLGFAGTDKVLVLTDTDNLEEASQRIQAWANEQYHGTVTTSTEKLNNSSEAYITDLKSKEYFKVVML